MSPAFQRSVTRDALAEHPRWRRLRSAPVAFLVLASAVGVCRADGARPKTAVLELRAAVGGVPADFGLAGARLLAGALAATGQYDVIDSEKAEAAVREHGLRPPFAVGHLQLLAEALDADVLVHGSVRGVTYDAEAGSASVILSIELVEGKSGRLRHRQQASGKRSAPTGIATGRQETMVGALAAAVESVVEALTGERVPAALQAASERESVAAWPLEPPRLAPAAVGRDSPKTGEPRADLLASGGEPEAPAVAVAPVTTPQPAPQPRTEAPPAPGNLTETQPEPPVEFTPEEAEDERVPLVQAKVLAKLGPDRALITLGKDAIVEPKMELEVYRVRYSRETERATKSRIGKLRVVKINPTDAEARILEGAEVIRTGDLAFFYGP
jgi:hypothetical protein